MTNTLPKAGPSLIVNLAALLAAGTFLLAKKAYSFFARS